MTIKEYFKKEGKWNVNCETLGCRAMSVLVVFESPDSDMDEVEFSIKAFDINELDQLFTAFCKESNYPRNTVSYIVVKRAAETMDKLIEMEIAG